ncbi:MAG: hypothetical protein KBD01_03705 [Acidobacteria bacterium]|nr:hypothetical protein [Acidobacteriota bacterium]
MRRSLCAIAFATVLLVAWTAVPAAELGGTSWTMDGVSRAKAKGHGQDRGAIGAILEFDGLPADTEGTCLLTLYTPDAVPLPCTWTTGQGRRFQVDVDDAELASALVEYFRGVSGEQDVAVVVAKERVHGVAHPTKPRISLKTKFKGVVSVGDEAGIGFTMRLTLVGAPSDV